MMNCSDFRAAWGWGEIVACGCRRNILWYMACSAHAHWRYTAFNSAAKLLHTMKSRSTHAIHDYRAVYQVVHSTDPQSFCGNITYNTRYLRHVRQSRTGYRLNTRREICTRATQDSWRQRREFRSTEEGGTNDVDHSRARSRQPSW